jgi:uncharacterized damage-inducible protein DinB
MTMTMPSSRQQFLEAFEREHATTMRLLRAYPADKLDLRPHPKCNKFSDLAYVFVREQALAEKALTKGFDWSTPPRPSPTPVASLDAITNATEEGHRRLADLVGGMTDDQLLETVKFFVAPKTLGDVRKIDFLWMLLFDQIHHRGQLSIYLRMADGKVPSIYGPTADEPWM